MGRTPWRKAERKELVEKAVALSRALGWADGREAFIPWAAKKCRVSKDSEKWPERDKQFANLYDKATRTILAAVDGGAVMDERALGALRKIPCDREGHERGCRCTVSSHGVALMDVPVWWIDRDGVRHERVVKAGERTGRMGEGKLVDAVEAGTGMPTIRKTRARRRAR